MNKKIIIIYVLVICYTTANSQTIQNEKMDTSITYIDSNGVQMKVIAPESYFRVDTAGKVTNFLKPQYEAHLFDSVDPAPEKQIIRRKKYKTVVKPK